MARIRHKSLDCSPGCAVEATLQLIDGKWKGVILYHLLEGTLRFNAIRRRLPNITQRMLTAQLRELEQDGFVLRTVYAEVPPKVEYSLTPRGRTLEPVIMALKKWGDENTGFRRDPESPAELDEPAADCPVSCIQAGG
ncbi:helix-turn-helix domain-containing protein [Komagataeibacter xylinus]|uniref:winged helix-turn-helix transcriptional regulator n=1 Tax=Komagataeibacter xylinus TaxID=28448 RepID=UPI00280BB97D|nr:helix-turn-helix domain-containing protein [Komagataeibacter xylinus]